MTYFEWLLWLLPSGLWDALHDSSWIRSLFSLTWFCQTFTCTCPMQGASWQGWTLSASQVSLLMFLSLFPLHGWRKWGRKSFLNPSLCFLRVILNMYIVVFFKAALFPAICGDQICGLSVTENFLSIDCWILKNPYLNLTSLSSLVVPSFKSFVK